MNQLFSWQRGAAYFLAMGLSWSLAAQNVGISVTNPIEKLDVNGDVYVRGDDVYFSHDSGSNLNNDYLSYDDVNNLPFLGRGMMHFHADNARSGTWDQPTASISARGAYFTGRIGVGTVNPVSVTHWASAGPAVLTLEADTDNVNENDNPRLDFLQDAGQVGVRMGFHDGAINDGNNFYIGTRYTNVDNWTALVINTQTRNIGIGTNTPDQRLELEGGGIQINDTFGIGFMGEVPMQSNVSGDGARIYYDGTLIGTYDDFLVFEKTDGNNLYPDGGFAFTCRGSDNVRNIAMVIRGNGSVGMGGQVIPGYALELPNNASVTVGRARANAWVTYSDGRLKSEQETIPYGLQTVLALRPLQYFQANSTQDETGGFKIEATGRKEVGFIAQELYELVPEAVDRPEDETKDLWSVDYTRLVPVLTRAIQEQQAQIKALEQRCEQLETQLARP